MTLQELGALVKLNRDKCEPFTPTQHHAALLQRMSVRWDDGSYDGCPTADAKRPFGNSGSVAPDIREILGIGPLVRCPECQHEHLASDNSGEVDQLCEELFRQMDRCWKAALLQAADQWKTIEQTIDTM